MPIQEIYTMASDAVERVRSRVHRAVVTPRVLREMDGSNDPIVRSTARAVRALRDDQVDDTARRVLDAIDRRSEYIGRQERSLVYTHFGEARVNHPDKSREELQAGITKEIQLRDAARSPPTRGRLLFHLMREHRPRRALEMGTSVGIGAAYQAAALQATGQGRLVSIEAAPEFAEVARETLESVELSEFVDIELGRFQDVLDSIASNNAPLDYAFIDGHHDEVATQEYLDILSPHLSEDALVVFDDIRWSDGMLRAWRIISRDERLRATVDLGGIGVAIPGREPIQPSHYVLRS